MNIRLLIIVIVVLITLTFFFADYYGIQTSISVSVPGTDELAYMDIQNHSNLDLLKTVIDDLDSDRVINKGSVVYSDTNLNIWDVRRIMGQLENSKQENLFNPTLYFITHQGKDYRIGFHFCFIQCYYDDTMGDDSSITVTLRETAYQTSEVLGYDVSEK